MFLEDHPVTRWQVVAACASSIIFSASCWLGSSFSIIAMPAILPVPTKIIQFDWQGAVIHTFIHATRTESPRFLRFPHKDSKEVSQQAPRCDLADTDSTIGFERHHD